MGVIKRAENLFEIRSTLSEETLYVPSSDEEEHYHPLYEIETERRQQSKLLKARPPPVGPAFSNLKNHSGKKKFRRYHNAHQLMTLAEEDELFEVTIEDFIASSKSPFSLLLEDDQSFEKWDKFVSSSEEKQNELLETKKKKKVECEKRPSINRALRSLLRKKSLPIGMLQYLEQELISFFSAQPTQTYISPALSSFERLLLHSVSDYHHLASLSFVSEPENVKLVQIKNPRKEFPSPPLLLVQYLESTSVGILFPWISRCNVRPFQFITMLQELNDNITRLKNQMKATCNFHRKRPHLLPPLPKFQPSPYRPMDPLQPPDLLLMQNRLGSPAPRKTNPKETGHIDNTNNDKPIIKISEACPKEENKYSLQLDLLSDVLLNEENIPERRGSNVTELLKSDRDNANAKNISRKKSDGPHEDLRKKLRSHGVLSLKELDSISEPKIFSMPNRYKPLKPIGQDKLKK